MVLLFFKQKTAYELRISDWSSDVCSSDLAMGDELVITGTLHKADMSERRDELTGADTTEQRLDLMLKLGPYGAWNGGDLSLKTLLDNPHEIGRATVRERVKKYV